MNTLKMQLEPLKTGRKVCTLWHIGETQSLTSCVTNNNTIFISGTAHRMMHGEQNFEREFTLAQALNFEFNDFEEENSVYLWKDNQDDKEIGVIITFTHKGSYTAFRDTLKAQIASLQG